MEETEVVRIGDPELGATWIVNYWGYHQDVPDMVLSNFNLVGGKEGTTPQIVFHETRPYSPNVIFNPIDERMMFSAGNGPNVHVVVNDILSACTGDCAYTFKSNVPEIISHSISGRTVDIGLSNPQNLNVALNHMIAYVDG